MPRSLADGKIKVSIMSTKPADPYAPTLTELSAGIDAAPKILSSGFKLGAVASETETEKPLSVKGNVKVFTISNYEGELQPFREFDATNPGISDTVGDLVYQALKTKGTKLWIAKRFTGKDSVAPWAAMDEVSVYEVTTDNPTDAEATGYIKKVVPLSVEDAWENGAVAAGA